MKNDEEWNARLEAIQKEERERTKRFMNAKQRSIGIDKDGLDRQIEEKRLIELDQKKEKLADAENLKQLVRFLDCHEAAVQEAKKRSLDEIKQSLAEQVKQPKNNALGKDGSINLTDCGTSSLQYFSGEDRAHELRKKAQQEQVKMWCAEDMVAKKTALDAELRKEQEYANYVLEQDRIRFELEEIAQRRREEDAKQLQLENLEYARQARQRLENEMMADSEAQRLQSYYLQTCPLLTEDVRSPVSSVNTGHRIRPDHFKGFQKEQVKQLYEENDAAVRQKHELLAQEAENEANWARYNAEMINKMQELEDAKQHIAVEENRVHKEILARQKKELDNRKAEMERERVHGSGPEFFARFGRSCR
jgi:hypothetical protein